MSVMQEYSPSRFNTLLSKDKSNNIHCEIKAKKVVYLDCVSDDEDNPPKSSRVVLEVPKPKTNKRKSL